VWKLSVGLWFVAEATIQIRSALSLDWTRNTKSLEICPTAPVLHFRLLVPSHYPRAPHMHNMRHKFRQSNETYENLLYWVLYSKVLLIYTTTVKHFETFWMPLHLYFIANWSTVFVNLHVSHTIYPVNN
jgi:hypothetical protein